MKFSFVHEFDIDAKGFWDLFLSPEFSEALMAALKMKNYKVHDKTDDGTTFKRTQSMEPQIAIPGMFAKFVPDLGYTEYDTLVRSSNSMKIVIEPKAMKDKFKTAGDFIVTPLGDNKCKREFRGECSVSIPFLGGKMEQFTVDQMKESYEVATKFTREWIAKNKK
jgi:hypothetical protein